MEGSSPLPSSTGRTAAKGGAPAHSRGNLQVQLTSVMIPKSFADVCMLDGVVSGAKISRACSRKARSVKQTIIHQSPGVVWDCAGAWKAHCKQEQDEGASGTVTRLLPAPIPASQYSRTYEGPPQNVQPLQRQRQQQQKQEQQQQQQHQQQLGCFELGFNAQASAHSRQQSALRARDQQVRHDASFPEVCILCGCVMGPDMAEGTMHFASFRWFVEKFCSPTPFIYKRIMDTPVQEDPSARGVAACCACSSWKDRVVTEHYRTHSDESRPTLEGMIMGEGLHDNTAAVLGRGEGSRICTEGASSSTSTSSRPIPAIVFRNQTPEVKAEPLDRAESTRSNSSCSGRLSIDNGSSDDEGGNEDEEGEER
jgi:hypothetical protein